MKKSISITLIVLRLFLGGIMIAGGIGKFLKPLPSPTEILQKAESYTSPNDTQTLQKILYISGSKQTGYFWELLGVCELLFGLLLVIQGTGFVGALLLLPITLNIFLFHLFLEPEKVGELVQWVLFLIINIVLVLHERSKWKHLLWIKPI
ncbi:MAG: DoxX family membrane protein [Flavobacteriaceae bacterium]